ncbi:MAG: UbiD family decarboxylase [Thermofilum sp.]|uniref:UbiD family decarboxylase n=1 Tax=Thermofilum sp. TaxID=1961369 RepID=UPI00258D9656|nr:UbiD family decarboxylase [Thermofilum sp.]MCI4408054.1 UbiD family decarboxylase [Thermofilum sp.]
MTISDLLMAFFQRGKLLEINNEVSPDFEIPWLSIELAKHFDHALLYSKVSGKTPRVLTNVFYKKIYLALNAGSEEQIINRASRVVSLIEPLSPIQKDKLHLLASLAWIADYYPEVKESQSSTIRVLQGYDLDLTLIPALKHSSQEEYPVMTNPLIIATLDSVDETEITVQRVQVVDEKTLLLHVPRNSRIQHLIEEASRRGKPLKVAVVLGAPASIYPSAFLSWLSFTEKLLLAGVISETKIATTKLEDNIYVPFSFQTTVIGEIVPGDERPEGKMLYENGEVLGGTPMPVIHAKKILMESNPIIYYSTIHPTQSDIAELFRLVEKIFLLNYKNLLPNVIDLTFLGNDAFRTVVAKVNTFKREKLINTGINLLSLSKTLNPYTDTIILVGPNTNIHNHLQLLKTIIENVDPDKDVIKIPQQDYETFPRRSGRGSLIIFATSQKEGEKPETVESYLEPTSRSQKIFGEILDKLARQST